MTIIKSNQWDQALRNSHGSITPLRELILKMPGVYKMVLVPEKCNAISM